MAIESQRLSGRRIMITGAASGMGRAVALEFARQGAGLVLLDRNEAGLRDAAAEADGADSIVTDVSSEDQVSVAVAFAVDKLGGIDGLVNCAGIIAKLPFLETSTEIWETTFRVNTLGPALLCRLAFPEMLKSTGAVPTVVNIASTAGVRTWPLYSAYSASKGALLSLTRVLAKEFGPRIRVNAICPGPIRTPMMATVNLAEPDGGEARLSAGVALGRRGTVDEIAAAALFLTSEESSYVNGESLVVDGGEAYV